MKCSRLVLLLLASLAVSACTTRTAYSPPPTYPQDPGQQQPEPPIAYPEPSIPEPPPQQPPTRRTAADVSAPAVLALMRRADERVKSGDLDSAAATLERALDLEPRNPFVYQRLAALRLEQGQAAQAEALARKSNSLAGNNPYIKTNNWRIIGQTRSMRGDTVGASSASSRVQYYQTKTGE